MFYKILDTELEYSNLFCREISDDGFVRFTDNKLSDVYMHNYLLVKKFESKQHFIDLINDEIIMRRSIGAKFCRIEYYFSVDESIVDEFPLKADKTVYDYYYANPNLHVSLKSNDDCKVVKADSRGVLRDGIHVDVLANKDHMGNRFAKKRIKRKAKVYRDEDTNLDLYVCYSDAGAVGNCEMLISDGIVKLEGFDILPEYQQKGYGTSMLKHLLKSAENSEGTYLVTDNSDTAKEMYLKCGFRKIGEKTELLFRFN